MKKTLYIDAFAGVSGDMMLSALLDLGVAQHALADALSGLELSGWSLEKSRVIRQGISANHVRVNVQDDQPHHRTYADIRSLIDAAPLAESVRRNARKVFDVLARAEAKIHDQPIDEVHFHEVGCVDSIIDIVGAAWCLDALGIDKIRYSTLPMAHGWVRSAHGNLPLPAPATVELMREMSVTAAPANMEWVTPTGAAILSALGEQSSSFPTAKLAKVGYGAGSKDPTDRPGRLENVPVSSAAGLE